MSTLNLCLEVVCGAPVNTLNVLPKMLSVSFIDMCHIASSQSTTVLSEKIVDEILALPVVISIWENITTDLDYEISKECKKLV